jgi:PhnB protein
MPETTSSVGHSSGVTAHLRVNDGRAAVAWYAKAFGAKELLVMPAKDGKRLLHAQLEINGGHLMLATNSPSSAATPPRPPA